MKLFYADHFVLPLPPGHRFPMEKYSRLRETLMTSGVFAPGDFQVPAAADDTALLRAHRPAYLQRVVRGELSAADEAGPPSPPRPGAPTPATVDVEPSGETERTRLAPRTAT